LFFFSFRTIDGSCNSDTEPTLGAMNTKFERFLPPFYRNSRGDPFGSSAFDFRVEEEVSILFTEWKKKILKINLPRLLNLFFFYRKRLIMPLALWLKVKFEIEVWNWEFDFRNGPVLLREKKSKQKKAF